MTIYHHPDDATLMSYAAGNLSEALNAVIASHVAMCDECRQKVYEYEALGRAFIDIAPEAEMQSSSLEAMMQRFDEMVAEQAPLTSGNVHHMSPYIPEAKADYVAKHGDVLPSPLQHYLKRCGSEIPWKFLAPGIKSFRIPLSQKATGDLRLLKIQPGCAMPEHGHGGVELTLVLSGAYTDRFGTFRRGDLADLADDVDHQPIVDQGEECICLVASERKAHFKSFVPRLLQPFIGM